MEIYKLITNLKKMKQITLGREARESLERGVNKLSEAVASTLGAKGNNVIFQHGKNYFVTKDGVTVASQVELEDPVENAAAQIVKDASSRTARDAGDGTTSSTVIAAGIIEAALRYAKDSGSAMEIKRGIDKAVEDAIEFIDQIKTSVKGEEDIFNIARISGNNDDKIGNMIADIYSKVGKEGAIRIEETQMNDTTVDVIEGCQFNSGYISDIFINNKTKGVADYKDAAILITDYLRRHGR
jgi:chaperonin GroEL